MKSTDNTIVRRRIRKRKHATATIKTTDKLSPSSTTAIIDIDQLKRELQSGSIHTIIDSSISQHRSALISAIGACLDDGQLLSIDRHLLELLSQSLPLIGPVALQSLANSAIKCTTSVSSIRILLTLIESINLKRHSSLAAQLQSNIVDIYESTSDDVNRMLLAECLLRLLIVDNEYGSGNCTDMRVVWSRLRMPTNASIDVQAQFLLASIVLYASSGADCRQLIDRFLSDDMAFAAIDKHRQLSDNDQRSYLLHSLIDYLPLMRSLCSPKQTMAFNRLVNASKRLKLAAAALTADEQPVVSSKVIDQVDHFVVIFGIDNGKLPSIADSSIAQTSSLIDRLLAQLSNADDRQLSSIFTVFIQISRSNNASKRDLLVPNVIDTLCGKLASIDYTHLCIGLTMDVLRLIDALLQLHQHNLLINFALHLLTVIQLDANDDTKLIEVYADVLSTGLRLASAAIRNEQTSVYSLCFGRLLNAVLVRVQQQTTDQYELDRQFYLCHRLVRIANVMSSTYKVEFAKTIPYLIADYLTKTAEQSIHGATKNQLELCMHRLLRGCDRFGIAMLLANLKSSSKYLFSRLYADYRKVSVFTV